MKRLVAGIVAVLLVGVMLYACLRRPAPPPPSPLERLLASGVIHTEPRREPDGGKPPPPDKKLPITMLESYYSRSEGFHSYQRFTCPGYEEAILSPYPVAEVDPKDPYLHGSFCPGGGRGTDDLRAFLRERVRRCARYYVGESFGCPWVAYVQETSEGKQYHLVRTMIYFG